MCLSTPRRKWRERAMTRRASIKAIDRPKVTCSGYLWRANVSYKIHTKKKSTEQHSKRNQDKDNNSLHLLCSAITIYLRSIILWGCLSIIFVVRAPLISEFSLFSGFCVSHFAMCFFLSWSFSRCANAVSWMSEIFASKCMGMHLTLVASLFLCV